MKKRIFSRLMAMVMALALLSTSALAYVTIDQNYIDELNKKVETQYYGEREHQYVCIPQGDGGDNEYKLVDDVNTDYSLRFREDAILDLNGFTINHQGREGSVIEVGNVESSSKTILTIKDSSKEGTGTITGGNVTTGYDFGGGIKLNGSTVILEGGNITGNKAYKGGGVGSGGDGKLIMRGGSITDNEAQNAGAVYLHCGGSVEITGGVITRNITTKQDQWSDALYDGIDSWWGSISGDAAVCGNGVDGKGINVYLGASDNAQQAEPCYHHYLPATCTAPATCTVCGETEGDVLPHTPGTPVRENEVVVSAGMSGSYDEVIYCTVCGEELSRSTRTIPTLPIPVDFGNGFTGGTDTGTNIDDETTPLAGIVTEAQLLDELYKHEGSPAVELVEKYASHEYAPAISWALANAIVEDSEDFDPDEAVTVALLREVLTAYVEYKGIDFTVTVTGEDDDLVLDLSERLTVFFAQLEK